MALARGEFHRARRAAEALLYDWAPHDVRVGALLVAGDAAYATRSYRDALVHYREFLSLQASGPQAAHAALQAAWAQLRAGQRDAARLSWLQTADRFPGDPRAALALVLAAELAVQAGDTATAIDTFDRVIAEFPSSAHAGTASLSRSILAFREQRQDEAMRDLAEVIGSHGTSTIYARRRIMESLAVPNGKAARGAPPAMRTLESDGALARFATAFLQAGEADSAPYVLHGLSLIGAVDGGWSDFTVATLVHRLVDGWPSYPAAPALLGRVVASAASAGQWPIARRAHEALTARYRGSAIASTAGVDIAETLVRAGAGGEARHYLEDALTAGGETEARALLLLARIEEELGNRRAALAAYDRVLREHPGVERPVASLQSHARLLESSGQPDAARSVLQRIVAASDGQVAGEASYRIAEILRAQGDEAAAAEWYLTAAYVAEGSKWERPSLLGAVRSLTALRHMEEALIIYRKAFAPRDSRQGVSASPPATGR